MKRILQIIGLAALAAVGYALWLWMNPAPEKVIRKQLAKLSESLVSKAGEGNFARIAAVNKALSFFTSDVFINGEGIAQVTESIQGKTELQQAIFVARSRLEGEIDFADVRVQVGPEETNAVANFTAVGRLAGQKEPYSQDLKAQFVKIERDWLISRVDAVILTPTKTAE